MKKRLFVLIGIIVLVVVGILYWNKISYLKIEQDVVKITVLCGRNGESIDIVFPEEIENIVHQINALALKRSYKIPPSTGWEIVLDFYSSDDKIIKRLDIKKKGIKYNDYFYGTNTETEKLLNFFQKKFGIQ